MAAGKGYGGKTVYGARVGILMLDTRWPRPPGDTGNAQTWPFPVLYKVVPGASARVVIHEKGKGLGPAFLKAAEELVKEGADGITTTGGFLAIFQKELAAHVKVPVASSSLMQIPMVERLLPPGKRVGVLSVQGDRITPEHWDAVGASRDTPVMGTEGGREFTRVMPTSWTPGSGSSSGIPKWARSSVRITTWRRTRPRSTRGSACRSSRYIPSSAGFTRGCSRATSGGPVCPARTPGASRLDAEPVRRGAQAAAAARASPAMIAVNSRASFRRSNIWVAA